MKTKVEINGYEIEIEDKGGLISVTATFEGDVVEEFQIDTEGNSEGEEEVQGFGEFGQEEEEDFDQEEEEQEEDFDQEEEGQEEDFDQEEEEQEEDFDQEEEGQEEDEEGQEEDEVKLESFQSFINKKK